MSCNKSTLQHDPDAHKKRRCPNPNHALLQELNNRHDSIVHLPVEIVSHIFTFCLPPSFDIKEDYYFYSSKPVPFHLGSLCRYWRHLAWSIPRLWNILWLSVNGSTSSMSVRSQLLAEWLTCSGQLPLFISIGIVECHPQLQEQIAAWDLTMCMVDTLKLYASCWKVLDCHLPFFHLLRLSHTVVTTLWIDSPSGPVRAVGLLQMLLILLKGVT